jgi:outer membrane protein TolC
MQNNVLQTSQDLAVLLGTSATSFALDTTFLGKIPQEFETTADISDNPQSKFYAARINQAQRAAVVARRSIRPGITLFGIYQARASGFDYNYTPQFPERYSQSYFDGVNPSRHNYVAGFSIFWNFLSPLRVRHQARAQEFVAEGFRNEFELVNSQLQNQLLVSDQRIANSLRSAREVPQQFQAASDAYLQKSVLYRNGLTNLPDLQLAMYALNRAELDRSVAFINVWQALLLKAAATGDFDLFINQTR